MRNTHVKTVTDLSGIVQDKVGNLKYVVGWQFSEDRALSLLVSHLFQPLHLHSKLNSLFDCSLQPSAKDLHPSRADDPASLPLFQIDSQPERAGQAYARLKWPHLALGIQTLKCVTSILKTCLYKMHRCVREVGNDFNPFLLGHELNLAGFHLCKDLSN